jgi:hypothetical protein
LGAGIPVLFRTYSSPTNETFNCTIWEAARATSAAPTIFERIKIGEFGQQSYIDGGLGLNNPTAQVLAEAELIFPGREVACVISIGTGQPKISSIQKVNLWQQVVPTDVIQVMIDIATDCETTNQTMARRFRDLPGFYFRFNVEQGMQDIQLADWDQLQKVIAHTVHYLKMQDVDQRVGVAVDVIRQRRGVLSTAQIGMEVYGLC